MSVNDELISVLEKVDLMVAELTQLRESGPRFKIVHRFGERGCPCRPGELVTAVYLVFRTREILLRLSSKSLIIFDFLARHSRLPQSASQISVAMSADPFYRRHRARVRATAKIALAISRSSIKVFIQRIRMALDQAFLEANIDVDPKRVVVSEATVTNEVVYKLRATCQWVHTY